MKAKWNTGRIYDAEGQIIVAELQDDGRIRFADLSRGIDGEMLPAIWTIRDEHDLERLVMMRYDENCYSGSAASAAFYQRELAAHRAS